MNDMVKTLVMGLLLTLLIHPVPIWIYRYCIRKKPVSPKYATLIVIIDAIVVFAICFMLTGLFGLSGTSMSAVVLWSYVCYKSLTNGYTKNDKTDDTDSEPAETEENELEQSKKD